MVDINTIIAGVVMFTLVVMALVALIIFARGRLVSTGAVTSAAGVALTVTVKEAGAEILPVASLAVRVCVVAPIGNAEPVTSREVRWRFPR